MFDIHLVYALDTVTQAQPRADRPVPVSTPDPVGPLVFGAVQDQLGLKLTSGKGQVDALVIDHVEKPSAN